MKRAMLTGVLLPMILSIVSLSGEQSYAKDKLDISKLYYANHCSHDDPNFNLVRCVCDQPKDVIISAGARCGYSGSFLKASYHAQVACDLVYSVEQCTEWVGSPDKYVDAWLAECGVPDNSVSDTYTNVELLCYDTE